MTNNPRKFDALLRNGIEIAERAPLQSGLSPHNESCSRTKAAKLGRWVPPS